MNEEQIKAVGDVSPEAMAGIQQGLERLQKMRNEEIPIAEETHEVQNAPPDEIITSQEEVEENPPEEIGEEDSTPHSPDAVKPDDDIFDQEKSKPQIEKAWKLKKTIHRERAEKNALQAEIDQLKQQLAQSIDFGTQYYQKGALSDLEKAKEDLKKSIEVVDLEAFAEANVAMNKAMLSLHELNRINTQVPSPTPHANPIPPMEDDEHELRELHENIAADWIEKHSYLQPASADYDANLATKVLDYAKGLEKQLTDSGRTEMIFSEPYFNKVEGYMEGIRNANAKRARDMASVNHIGGVRGATPAVRRAAPAGLPPLTDNEKQMARNMGISEEAWQKRKQAFQQSTKR